MRVEIHERRSCHLFTFVLHFFCLSYASNHFVLPARTPSLPTNPP